VTVTRVVSGAAEVVQTYELELAAEVVDEETEAVDHSSQLEAPVHEDEAAVVVVVAAVVEADDVVQTTSEVVEDFTGVVVVVVAAEEVVQAATGVVEEALTTVTVSLVEDQPSAEPQLWAAATEAPARRVATRNCILIEWIVD